MNDQNCFPHRSSHSHVSPPITSSTIPGLDANMGWGDWKRNFHAPKEDEYQFMKRLGMTPPEFWTGRDHMEARILRAKRRRYEYKLDNEGKNPERINNKYPQGPFWPATPLADWYWYREVQNEGMYAREREDIWRERYGYSPDQLPARASRREREWATAHEMYNPHYRPDFPYFRESNEYGSPGSYRRWR